MKQQAWKPGVCDGKPPGLIEPPDRQARFVAASAVALLRYRRDFAIDRIPEDHEFALREVLVAEFLLAVKPLRHVPVDRGRHRNWLSVLHTDEADDSIGEINLGPLQLQQRALSVSDVISNNKN